MFSLEYAQLLTQGKDFDAEVVTGTKKSAKAGKETKRKWNHEFRFIA
ncbi:MAG: hypothetical protein LAP85_20925 [Acidobacteriia bacterium]|nr:hypothetical protein [Terriglobia bacterium]